MSDHKCNVVLVFFYNSLFAILLKYVQLSSKFLSAHSP